MNSWQEMIHRDGHEVMGVLGGVALRHQAGNDPRGDGRALRAQLLAGPLPRLGCLRFAVVVDQPVLAVSQRAQKTPLDGRVAGVDL